ncbi:MAG: PKD domain-containing protein [Bacteroidales bacterium]
MITAYPLPTALFEVYENCVNNVTHFTDYSNGAGANVVSWFWDFGDPSSGSSNYSTLQNPTHVYSDPGFYDVYLHVTNANGCSNWITQTIEVLPGPVADFQADSVCLNTPTYFDNLSYAIGENIISWYWDFGDGTSSTLQYPIHTYTSPGTYYVTLSVTTDNGCTDDITREIRVRHLPVADFEYLAPNCFGDSTYFTDLSYSIGSNIINSWWWDFGDGTYDSTHQHPVHLYTVAGTYTVTLTVYDTNGCGSSVQKSVTVNSPPIAEFSYSTQSCDTVQFTDQSAGVGDSLVSWQWDFGDPSSGWNNYSMLQDPVHIYYGSDSYDVTLIVTDALGCTDTVVHTLNLEKPEADFVFNSTCAGGATQFTSTSTSTGGPITSYFWDFGDGSTSMLQNPPHTYTSGGIYYVTLTVTNENGCSNIITRPVTIYNPPVADFTTNSPMCYGDSTYFTDLSYSIGSNIINSWQWDFGDGTTDTVQHPVHLYGLAGDYTVMLTVTDTNGCSHTAIKAVGVDAAPIAAFTYNNNSCDTVYFYDQSSAGGDTIISWWWDFGDPSSGMGNYSAQQDPMHVYITPGIYDVTLVVTSQGGCTDTITHSVDVDVAQADFSYTTACWGTATEFTDLSTGGSSPISGHFWDFGDGYTSTQTDPVHVYASAGTYPVTLTITCNNGCSDAITKTVTVNEAPLADFEYLEPNCQGDSTYFMDLSYSSVGIDHWQWDFGDGIIDTVNQDPVHLYASGGVYQVTLIVTDTNGCTGNVTRDVFVNPPPVASFNYSTSSCDTVQFTDQSIGVGDTIQSWLWDFGDPSSGSSNHSTQQNPVHVYVTPGTYTVALIVTDAHGCQDTLTQELEMYKPVADFSADTACKGTPTQFTDLSYCTGSAITGWLWDFGDGTTSVAQHPQHTYASAGYYYVTLTVYTPAGCQSQRMEQVYVQFNPTAGFTHSGACQGDAVLFTDQSSAPNNGVINNWQWDFGDGGTSTQQNPSHTYASAGTYQVTLTVWTANGCSSTVSKSVTITDSPVADFYADSACQGTATQFTDISYAPGSSIMYWWWDFGDGQYATGVQHPSHVYPSAGTYSVTLIVGNMQGCEDTISKDITVRSLPLAGFTADTACVSFPTQFTDLSQPAGSIAFYSWDFGDPSSGAANYSAQQHPIHYYNTPGTYNVTLTVTDHNGCAHTIIQPVLVTEPPLANFSFSDNQCAGDVIAFDDLSTTPGGMITTWIWDYGDNTPADTIHYPDDPDGAHVYAQAGNYLVELKVITSGGCYDIITRMLQVIPAPVADFTYDGGCENAVVNFTDQSLPNGGSQLEQWYWDFGDPGSPNNTSTLQDPAHQFSAAGTYTVMEIVSNVNGCRDTIFKDITIAPAPAVDFTVGASCLNETTYFYIDSTVVNTSMTTGYLWDFGDGGFTNVPNPTHVYSTVGVFDVTLTITDTNGCENWVTHQVEVRPLPQANFDHSGPVCLQDSVYFQDYSSTTYGYIVSWTWDFDDGSPTETIYFPDNPNVWHAYSAPGTYGATLTVTNSDSCQHTFTREVTVKDDPIANFQWSTACEDALVQFTDASYPNLPGSIISWQWDFDDPGSGVNNISYEQNPTHLFTYGDSTYYVTLIIVTNENCVDTMTRAVYVGGAPAVDFGYDMSCEDTLISFWPDSTVMDMDIITSWHWDFGDGMYGYDPYVQHLYNSAGTYTVTLTVTDTSGCENAISQDIQVIESPVSLFTITAPNCQNNPVFFDDNSFTTGGYIVRWYWDFGDGEDTTVYYPGNGDVEHIYEQLGTYSVTLQVTTSDSCQNSSSRWVTIDPAPIAYYEYDGHCQDEVYSFTDLSVPNGGGQIMQWWWDFGDPSSGVNNTSSLQHPTHQFSAPGSYDVTLQVTNVDGCIDTITQTVEVSSAPPVAYTYSGSCHGDTTYFEVDETITNTSEIAFYDWDFGDGSAHSSQMNPTHVYNTYGSYQVTLTVTDTMGCDNSVMHTVDISAPPTAVFNYEASCTGIPTQFTDYSYVVTGGNITAWSWDFGDPSSGASNQSGAQHPTHVYGQVGSYQVTLVVTGESGCVDSITMQVDIQPGPEAWFAYDVDECQNGLVFFEDSSLTQMHGITGWKWTFEPGHYSTVRNPQYIFPQTDTCYDVMLEVTDAQGCKDTVTRQVCVPAGLEVDILFTQACLGEDIHFSDSVLQPQGAYLVSYHWDFGEPLQPGNTSTVPTPHHRYSSPGVYTVTLNAMDNHGCNITVHQQVMVDKLPLVDFTWSAAPCDTTLMFYDMSSGNGVPVVGWEWYFGDGTPSVTFTPPLPAEVTHKYAQPGDYTVRLVVTNANGCSDTLMQEVTCNPCINSVFDIQDTLCCQHSDLTFSDSTVHNPYIILWEWNWGDGSDTVYIHPAPNLTHKYQQPGNYLVRLVIHGYVNNTNIYDTAYRMVEVLPTPDAGFSFTNVCEGDRTLFMDSTISSGLLTNWRWDFGDPSTGADTSGLQNPVYTFSDLGQYYVQMHVENQHGCRDSVRRAVQVHARPQAGFSTTPVCRGDVTGFFDESDGMGGEIISWHWDFGDGDMDDDTSLTQNPLYKYDDLGTHTVSLRVINEGGCMDTLYKQIDVHPVPVSSFDVLSNHEDIQGNVYVRDYSQGATEYEWHWGDGFVSYEDQDPVLHQYDQDGSYDIQLVVWNEHGCADTSWIEYEFIFKSLYVPNAFVPQSSNAKVREFKPKGMGLQSYVLQIFDGWGNLLWETSKLDEMGRPAEGWDGTFKGELMPQDVYMWRIKATFRDGSVWEGESVGNMDGLSKEASGTVTLIK